MIELFKIVKGTYDHACIPHFDFVELSKDLIRTRGNKINWFSITVTINWENLTSLTGYYPSETVCLTMSYLLTLLTLSNIV